MKRRGPAVVNQLICGDAPQERLNLLDPALPWRVAIDEWRQGSEGRLCKLLEGESEIPSFARAWLSQLAAGQVERKRGRRPADAGKSLRDLVPKMKEEWRIEDAFRERLRRYESEAAEERAAGRKTSDGSPRDKAIEATALELGISESKVRSIIAPLPQKRRQVKTGNSTE